MRRFGKSFQAGIEYKHRPGVYGVILHGRDIMLTHQALPESEVQLPGGGIDEGESAVQALHRECLEETGWKIQINRRLGAYQRFTYMPEYGFWAQKICHIYRLSLQIVCIDLRLRLRGKCGARRSPVRYAETIAGSCPDTW